MGLRNKFFLLLLFLSVPILLVITIHIYSQFDRQIDSELKANQELAGAISVAFNNHLNHLWDAALALGLTVSLQDSPEEIDRLLSSYLTSHPTLLNISWLDPTGTVIASTEKDRRGHSLADDQLIQQIIKGEERAISGQIVSSSAAYTVKLAHRIYLNDTFKGIMEADLNLEYLGSVLPSGRQGNSTFALVDKNASIVYDHTNPYPSFVLRCLGKDSPALLALKEETATSGRFRSSSDGLEHVGGAVPIAGIGWAVIASTPVDQALAAARLAAVKESLILLAIIGSSLLVAAIISGQFLRGVTALQRTALRITRGELGARVPLTGDDEVAAAAHTFNQMVDHIESTEAALQGRISQLEAIAVLGQKVLESTDPSWFMNEAARTITKTLNLEYTHILELSPSGTLFHLRVGTGWDASWIGSASPATATASPAGYALSTGEPLVVEDLRTERRFAPSQLLESHDVISNVCVLIPGQNQPFGILGIGTLRKRPFTRDDLHFLQSVANLISTTLIRHRADQIQAIQQAVTHVLAVSAAANEAIPRLLQTIGNRLGCEVGAYWAVDAAAHELCCRHTWYQLIALDSDPDAGLEAQLKATAIRQGEGLLGRVWSNGEPAWAEQPETDDLLWSTMAAKLQLLGACYIPVKAEQEVFGVLQFLSHNPQQPADDLLQLLRTMGNHIGQFIRRRQAEDEILRLNAGLERRVLERTAELTAVNKELEAFCFSVSHDLRAPLRSIDGFSRALLEDYAAVLGDSGNNLLQRICSASHRMEKLISDMLHLSRLTLTELRLKPVDLSQLSQTIVANLQIEQPNRILNVTIESGLIATGDEDLLRVVLENLLRNAWKFTARKANAQITFGVKTINLKPTYFVRDNGVGFDMNYADKLFRAFQRLHPDGQFEGSGIGLAIVSRIIHRHHGEVWGEGKVGEGATFYFTLP